MKRKSQVDLAVTIGAIIIPAAALIGSLVFAFSLLGIMVDAAKMAASIDHDLAVLQDVVSSSPDSITIYYKPTSLCKYNSNQQRFNCLDNKVTISGPLQNNYYRYTLLDSMVGDGLYHILPYYNSISLSVYYLDESTLKMVPLSGVEYRDYASIFDYVDSAVRGSNSISSSTPLTVSKNGYIQITKTREIVDRAQTPVNSQEDLILPIVQAIKSVCDGDGDRNIAIKIPPHLGIAFDDSTKSITEFEYTYDISYDAYNTNNFPEKQINLATVSLPNDFQCAILPSSSYPANDHFLKHILKLKVSKDTDTNTVTVEEDSS